MNKKLVFALFSVVMVLSLIALPKTSHAETTRTIPPSGDAKARATKEVRQFRHSSLEPTGLYVKKGDTIEIDAQNLENAKVFLGQYGTYNNLNSGKEVYSEYELVDGKNSFTMEDEIGQVYIKNLSETKPLTVTITGGRKEPIYILGQTTEKEFFDSLEEYSEAPFFELVGNNVFGTFQMRYNKEVIKGRSQIKDVVEYLDEIALMQNNAMGLQTGSLDLGVNRKFQNRIQIINTDDGGGAAYATENFVNFHQKGGLVKDILAWSPGNDTWSIWHEIGHTYQNPYMMWSSDNFQGYSLTEVTVNISSLYVQHSLGQPNRLIKNQSIRQKVQEYLGASAKTKDFDTASIDPYSSLTDNDDSLWMKLTLYNQLMYAYGFDIFAYVNQEYRLMLSAGESMPKNDEEKRQMFMRTVSKVTKRNLIDYFTKWGLYPNTEVKEFMSSFSKPAVAIEENLLPGNDAPIVDIDLGKFETPTVETQDNVLFILGDQAEDYDITDLLKVDSEKNMPSGTKETFNSEVLVTNDLLENSTVTVKLTNSQGVTNTFPISLNKSYGNAISMQAYVREERAIFTLQKKSKTIESFTDEKKITPLNSGTGQYVKFQLFDNEGNLKLERSANREDAPQKFVHNLRGVDYEDGDIVCLTIADSGKLQSYVDGEISLRREESRESEYFKIEQDQFHHLDDTEVIPNAKTKNIMINIGEEAPAATEFVEDVSSIFGPANVSVTFKAAPSVTTAGSRKVDLVLTDTILGSQASLSSNLEISYDNSLALAAYSPTDIRAVLRLDKEKQTLIGYSNPDRTTNIASGSDKYWQVKLIREGEILVDESVNANTTPFDFVNRLNGIEYKEGDILYLYAAQSYVENYQDNQKVDGIYQKDNYFKITNNQFIQLNNNDLLPSAKAKDVVINIGEEAPAATEFVEDVSSIFGPANVSVTFKAAPSVTTAGSRKVDLVLTDTILGSQASLSSNLEISYDNSLALAAYSPTDIRAVLRLDKEKQTLIGYSNPDRTTNIASGSGKYWQVKLIREGEILVDESVNANTTPFDFVNRLNGIEYKEGDILYLYAAQSYVENYQDNQKVDGKYQKDNYFKITNNQFVSTNM